MNYALVMHFSNTAHDLEMDYRKYKAGQKTHSLVAYIGEANSTNEAVDGVKEYLKGGNDETAKKASVVFIHQCGSAAMGNLPKLGKRVAMIFCPNRIDITEPKSGAEKVQFDVLNQAMLYEAFDW